MPFVSPVSRLVYRSSRHLPDLRPHNGSDWMHSQKYAAPNILRRVPLLCHFADFTREKGATDLASATSLVDKFASHWVARANCKNAATRRNLCDDIQSVI